MGQQAVSIYYTGQEITCNLYSQISLKEMVRARILWEFTRINIDCKNQDNQLLFTLNSHFKKPCNYIYKCNYNNVFVMLSKTFCSLCWIFVEKDCTNRFRDLHLNSSFGCHVHCVSWPSYMWTVFHLSSCLIPFGSRSANLADTVHKVTVKLEPYISLALYEVYIY